MEIRTTAPIAIIGAGTMGAGIAQVAATAGHPVTVIDQNEAALERGRTNLVEALAGGVRRGRIDDATRQEIEARISWSTDLPSAGRHDLVIEAIVENLEAKRNLVGALARVMRCDALIASNTSSLGIGDIGVVLAKPERFLGLHFFNPVPAMKLVEVIAGPATDPAIVDGAVALMRAWGKYPVVVRDVPGFIVNRVARPYYAEGFAALDEGIAAATIDAAFTETGAFRMGPLTLADMIGQEINFGAAVSVHDAYGGATRFRPQAAQRALVEAGRFGRKTGQGVYDYGAPLSEAEHAAEAKPPISIALSRAELLAPLIDAAREKGIAVVEEQGLEPDMIRIGGSLAALGDGRPLAARPDVDVLIDYSRDFAHAASCVISATSAEHAATASGFLQAIGRQALVIPGRPGQIVLRTLAQLANAAADAVTDDVASADGIDEAMLYGANHPEGPLGWARRIGHERVRTALANIAGATGDAMYTPSSLFLP